MDYSHRISKNGTLISESTVSKSNTVLPTLNGRIPDFSAGENEYHPLLITDAPVRKIDVLKKISISIVVFILIGAVSVFVVIKYL